MAISRGTLSKLCLALLCTHLLIQHHNGFVEGRAAAASDDESDEDFFNFGSSKESEEAAPPPPTVAKVTTTTTTTTTPKATTPPIGIRSAFGTAQNNSNNDNHDRDDHEEHISSNNQNAVHSGASAGQSQRAGFNETCGHEENSIRCNAENDLTCSKDTNTCICSKSDNFVYVKSEGKCLIISARSTQFSCIRDEQCHEGTYGPYSFCNVGTGRCECSPTTPPPRNVPVIRHEDKCIIRKQLGDYCLTNEECQASLSIGKAICIYKPPENTGEIVLPVIPINATMQCLCDEGYIFDNTTTANRDHLVECLPKARDESSTCITNLQCTSSLGPLSRCFQQTCQCADVLSQKGEAVFYKGQCYILLGLGDNCDSDDQCKAGIHDDAVCANTESYIQGQKTCQCPPGKTCIKSDDGGAGNILISINLLVIGFTATRIIA